MDYFTSRRLKMYKIFALLGGARIGDSIYFAAKECLCGNSNYPISTLPEHLHSTFPSYAKLPENTLTEKEKHSFSLFNAHYLFDRSPSYPTPFTGRPSHTLSYTTILFLALKVNGRFLESLPVVTFASLELKLPVFSFH